ncbi:MAG: alpha/beta hydrolase [Bacteroidota bacterium]
MTDFFKPSISYWAGSGTEIRDTALQVPSGALNQRSLVLLVHGYNNDVQDASDAFKRFLSLQQSSRTIGANLVGVYWPGANWSGPLYYMAAVSQAKKVAVTFARDLYEQAIKGGNYLKVDFVAHSLGCRLTLETIKELVRIKQNNPSLGGLVLGRVVFMAGAVPTRYLDDLQFLRGAITAFGGTMSLFSEDDLVLHWAFPAGQTAAWEGFFPVALGRKKWSGDNFLAPPIQQIRNPNAGHGDYWGGDDDHLDRKAFAAGKVAEFIQIGEQLPRSIHSADASLVRDVVPRKVEGARTVKGRVV